MRRPYLFFCGKSFFFDVTGLFRYRFFARVGLIKLEASSVQPGLDIRVLVQQSRSVSLQLFATILQLAQSGPAVFSELGGAVAAGLQFTNLVFETAHVVFTRQNARTGILVAADSQPVSTEPDAVRRNHRPVDIKVRQLLTNRQCLVQSLRDTDSP